MRVVVCKNLLLPLVLATLCILASPVGFAKNADRCPDKTIKATSDKDLRDCLPMISNQDGLGWCYAYGTAAQLTCWAVKNKVDGIGNDGLNQVSPAACAMLYNRDSRRETAEKAAAAMILLKNAQGRMSQLEDQSSSLYRQLRNRKDELANGDSKIKELKEKQRAIRLAAADPHSPGDGEAELSDAIYQRKEELISADKTYQDLDAQAHRAKALLRDLEARTKVEYEEPEGGNEKKLIDRMIPYGMCLESQVNSLDNSSVKTFSDRNNWKYIISSSMKNYYQNPSDDQACRTSKELSQVFPMLTLKEIYDILLKAEDIEPIEELWKKACLGHSIPFPRTPVYVPLRAPADGPLGRRALLKAIDQSLDEGDIVGVSYHSEIFDTGKDAVEATRGSATGSHYSLIAGKRFNCQTKHTEYIIRNSWGTEACETNRKNFRRYPYSETPPEISKQMDNELKVLDECKGTCRKTFPVQDEVNSSPSDIEKNLRTCLDRCTATYYEHIIQINQVPYTCDKADYVVRDDQLAAGIIDGNTLR